MKKGAAYLGYAAVAVFIAACAWTLAFFIRREAAPETVSAVRQELTLSVTAGGLIWRDERIVCAGEDARLAVKSGDRLRGGGIIAVSEDAESVLAPCGGIFSTLVDGYEGLSPSELGSAVPSVPEGAVGRIVSGGWLFIAETEQFDKFRQGQRVFISLPEEQEASVVYSSGGRLVLRCLGGLEDVLGTRRAVFEIRLKALSGLKVPKSALHSDSDGSFVYVLRAGVPERCAVEILDGSGEYLLVKEDELRENMQIIIE